MPRKPSEPRRTVAASVFSQGDHPANSLGILWLPEARGQQTAFMQTRFGTGTPARPIKTTGAHFSHPLGEMGEPCTEVLPLHPALDLSGSRANHILCLRKGRSSPS